MLLFELAISRISSAIGWCADTFFFFLFDCLSFDSHPAEIIVGWCDRVLIDIYRQHNFNNRSVCGLCDCASGAQWILNAYYDGTNIFCTHSALPWVFYRLKRTKKVVFHYRYADCCYLECKLYSYTLYVAPPHGIHWHCNAAYSFWFLILTV